MSLTRIFRIEGFTEILLMILILFGPINAIKKRCIKEALLVNTFYEAIPKFQAGFEYV